MRSPRLAYATLILLIVISPALGATVREGFVEHVVATGLGSPTAMAFAPDGRLFVAEQTGRLRVIKDGMLLPAPFVQLTVNASGERGLLGVALDPDFPLAPFVYVYYTAVAPTVHNRVSRFTAQGDIATAGSELVLLDLPTLSATNHNGGAIHFGPDGLLYIAVGENAVPASSQSLNTPLGKILRVARDGSIPSTNPFFGQTSGINRAIWALGLRNPFTFGIDPLTGRMLINDVGQSAWEEINEGLAGANYGWPDTEGPTTDPRFRAPLYAYSHGTPNVCAITGGAFYPSAASAYPAAFAGDYFFADLCAGWIRQLDAAGSGVEEFASGIAAPVDLAIGPEGSLYYLARGAGAATGVVARIEFSGEPVDDPPMAADAPVPRILAPLAGAPYTAGSRIRYAGDAVDSDGRRIPASGFTWRVVFHHPNGSRPVGAAVTGTATGSFLVPNTGITSPDVYYRIHLTATDAEGRSAGTFVDVRPHTTTLTLATNTPGLLLLVDGRQVAAPFTMTTVVGMRVVVEAPAAQTIDRQVLGFRGWSDGGVRVHTVVARGRPATITASYRVVRIPTARTQSCAPGTMSCAGGERSARPRR